MPVRKLSDNCLQIRRFNAMNCYLLRERDGLTVIDTAMGAARIILEAARYLGQPIRRILLTHAHGDHVGSVDALVKRNPGLQVIASQRDSLLLEEAARGVKQSRLTLLPGEPQKPVKGSFQRLRNLPGTQISEGDTVGSLDVIATPGHTPGHLAFFDRRDGTLFAGDALNAFGGLHLPFDPPWYFPFPAWATWDNGLALASARTLSGLDISQVLCGHGPALGADASVMRAAVQAGERRLRSS